MYVWGVQVSFAWISFIPAFSAFVNFFLVMNIIVGEARIECLLDQSVIGAGQQAAGKKAERTWPLDYSDCRYDGIFWTEYILEDENNIY